MSKQIGEKVVAASYVLAATAALVLVGITLIPYLAMWLLHSLVVALFS